MDANPIGAALMGWISLAAFGVATFVTLRLAGVPRALGWFTGAALLLGAAGYALQQRAGLAGHPVAANAHGIDVDPGMAAFRQAILPGTADDARILAAADSLLRAGATGAAAENILTAIARRPRDAALWTGLGSALLAHDGGEVSPAARFAFVRAWRLSPREPGPPFFLGLAMLQAGDLPGARTAWLRAFALTPVDAPYRIDIAERLVMLDQFEAMARAAR